ncbi:MAG TPA: sterol desaturase family protein [Polyangiaceae bacterium]|jgi:sterol desaturase/sphingolipid hydroxylase (fatty acid hydroxylase superfamily)
MISGAKQDSPRMFESDLFERFSRAHPLTPAIIYLPLVAIAIGLAFRHGQSAASIALNVFGGYLLWTLTEYWLHRLVFHLPVIGPKTERAAFLIHGVHHDYPYDESRLVMPAGASLSMCAITLLIFRATLGTAAMWAPLAGFVLGYVIYDEVHWYLHAGKPTSRFGRWFRRQHFLHHFKEPSSRFGVSCPWLDYAFGSAAAPRRRK